MTVRVEASARLHLGMIDLHGGLGRKFGSLGVAIEQPRVVVESAPGARLVVCGPDGERAEGYARRFLARHAPGAGAHLDLVRVIPPHVGLGSGTQLALTVGMALNQLLELGLDVSHVAATMGRGERSGIGIGAFTAGGFVADAGARVAANGTTGSRRLPPIVFQHPFPAEWAFVVAIPEVTRGLSGVDEDHAFAQLPPAPPELPGRISRLLVMKLLPALLEEDIESFGEALTEIQYLVGDSFAASQGGRFACSTSGDLIRLILDAGAKGAGQSSWGPTVYGLTRNRSEAEALAVKAEEFLKARTRGEVFVTAAANTGWRLAR